ncbi:unnamed protein product [Rotaria sordida]|uniref:Uncharacterized protein n=2 Tax=Rotaria sordida TaxID=392033 RepID=A0A818X239_9BILA|nr:unnamed protein product [Rotaria sordida]
MIIGQGNSKVSNLIKLLADALGKLSVEINSVVGQRMIFILQHLQDINMHLPSTSNSLSQKPFVIEYVCPRLAPTVIQKYQNNEIIKQYLQLVPKLLLSDHSLMVLKELHDAAGPIIYPDLPQNCGGLQVYLYKYNKADDEMFTVDMPVNENDCNDDTGDRHDSNLDSDYDIATTESDDTFNDDHISGQSDFSDSDIN